MNVADPSPIAPESGARLEELKAFVAELSGADLSEADGDASFLELGFDSLFLTQLTQAIQGKYRVKLTFRQIMENYPTLGALASHLEAVAPQASSPAAAARPAQAPLPAQAAANASAAPGGVPVLPLPPWIRGSANGPGIRHGIL